MDKMAQWKSSILGINKSSHGGPVKGKMPMSAPMAKYANGGRVVKMQEGGNPGGRPKGQAGTWKGTRPGALAALSRSASSVRNSSDSDTDSLKSRIKKVSEVSISKPKAAVFRAVTPPKSTMGDNEKDTSVKINSMPTDSDSGPGDYGRGEPAKATSAPSASTKSVSTSSVPTKSSEGPSDYGDGTASAKGKSSFGRAFRAARKAMENGTGGKTFTWNGESYSTRKAEESIKDFNAKKYAKGGKVMAKGGAADMKQDKAMIARHNRLMHSGQKSKLKNGGMMKKGGGGAMRVQGDMKRPQFSASKSFDGGKTRIGMSAGKGNFRASFSKKFADGGAVTRLANEASGVISDMTKNRAMMKKGGSVKKGSMMKAKGSMMKAMSNKR